MASAPRPTANTASSLYKARFDGFIDDPVSGPMRRPSPVAAYLAGGVVRGLAIGLFTFLAAPPVRRPARGQSGGGDRDVPVHVAAFSAMGVGVGLIAKTWDQQSYVGNLVLQPLVFLGGVFYSVNVLAEPWRGLTKADPFLYMVAASRHGMLGTSEVKRVALARRHRGDDRPDGRLGRMARRRGAGLRT